MVYRVNMWSLGVSTGWLVANLHFLVSPAFDALLLGDDAGENIGSIHPKPIGLTQPTIQILPGDFSSPGSSFAVLSPCGRAPFHYSS